jgi:hypothetical protein
MKSDINNRTIVELDGAFLDHLASLAGQTSAISQSVAELIEVLEHATTSIWYDGVELGNFDPVCDSSDFTIAVEQIISNLVKTSRQIAGVWSVMETISFFSVRYLGIQPCQLFFGRVQCLKSSEF